MTTASGNQRPSKSARRNDQREPAGSLPFLAKRAHSVLTHPIPGVEKQELLRAGVDSDDDLVVCIRSVVAIALDQSDQDRAVPTDLTLEVAHLALDQKRLQPLAPGFIAKRARRDRLPGHSGRSPDLRGIGGDAPAAQDHGQRRGSAIVLARLADQRHAAYYLPAVLRPELRR